MITDFRDLNAPLFFAWQITGDCNLRCLHCCEESGHSIPGEMRGKEIMKVCREIIDMGIPYVAISGGEPMLHPDFYKMCETIRGAGIDMKIETNGLYVTEEAADWFKKLKFRSVQISVDGATPEAHLKLRDQSDWERTIDACKLLVKRKINTEIVFVPTRFNINEIGGLIDLAHSLGIYGVYTGKIMRIGRAALNWDRLNPTEEQYKEFFDVLQKKINQYDGGMKVYYYPYDVIEELKYRLEYPAASLLVVPNGFVKLIGPLPFVCGNLKKQKLSLVWENYKKAWKDKRVIEFTKRVIEDPKLLAESNNWVELYPVRTSGN